MPATQFKTPDPYKYLPGFHCYHETEAEEGALPIGQNSPQKPPLGLYTEKLSGTAFTAPKKENCQSWLYRILPACGHSPFVTIEDYLKSKNEGGANGKDSDVVWDLRTSGRGSERWLDVPNQLRWDPFSASDGKGEDWVRGLKLLAGQGDPVMKSGLGIYIYSFDTSMSKKSAFYSADGDFLIVPQQGTLNITTELGRLMVRPMEICVIPRGVRYRVELVEDGSYGARGYVLELFEQGHFELPELGPIGSNGLANSGDFQCPVAYYEDDEGKLEDKSHEIFAKFGGKLFVAQQDHTPFDIVAWKGNYYPYKYDLGRFNTIGTISYDHPDPSIFTVLTAPSHRPGTAVADFVIFPPRWLVAEDTFRPPYFHRNCMSEFMGMIAGEYDGKASGFAPGGASLHNVFSGHGPDAPTHKKASEADLKPQFVGAGSMAFMFESCLMIGVTEWGLKKTQSDYNDQSWARLERGFWKRNLPENK